MVSNKQRSWKLRRVGAIYLAANEAGIDPVKFKQLFYQNVIQPVKNNLELLNKAGWE